MSISASEKTVKKSISHHHHHHHHHRRNKSGDLDVLEAARYFSSAAIAENRSGGGRMSLDVPVRSLLTQETPSTTTVMKHQQQVNTNKEKKKHPKPSSPGARLTTFLNSIFSHNAEKKKNKKKAKSIKHHEDQVRDRHNAMDLSWLDEKLKLIESNYNTTTREKQKRLDGQSQRKETVSVEVDDHEEGADESDCSSDLFELENCDLGLPVYETTNMDIFKRPGPSIAAAAAAPPL